MARDAWGHVLGIFGAVMFHTRIHQSDCVGRAAGKGIPILLDAPRRREAVEYELLTEEVLARVS